ncbi:hypothetical protein MSG28_006894 [Choristoneura fumiferana]|uniref:Uncharacterized protein n=1 Tax=Choristoneura fumiferana TaxID=7141 RepID=A0ACC0JLH5_CHOFU|nr:hypothetical protein MSG28_006894 [Choristoneura fumiferana]
MEMANSGGVNPAQSDTVRAELYVDSETAGIQREQPPPYTEQPPCTIIRETVIIQPPLKDSPLFYPCPRCRKRVLTKVLVSSLLSSCPSIHNTHLQKDRALLSGL